MLRKIAALCLLLPGVLTVLAQNPQRFQSEIDKYSEQAASVSNKNLILFTGSSSIRIWNDVGERFPEKNIINRGFGGSTMADLLYYEDELIFRYKPAKIFIYEGDNDINAGKTTEEILKDAEALLQHIRTKLPKSTKVYFICAKPSVARWKLKEQYEQFNAQLKAWTQTEANVEYVDVWTPMLQPNGEVMNDIFMEDNLHMTPKGYDIWEKVIRPYL